jgi:geranylgeranyl diphosphate synthase type I
MSPTASTSSSAPLEAARPDGLREPASGSAPVALAEVRDLVDGPLREAVGRLDPGVRKVAAYHFGWVDPDGRPREANAGKAVRPALAVLSAQATGADRLVGVPGAVAVELVHNFSLLHDDVMDRDEERRHRPTAWTVFGNSAAILAGDALLALAFESLLDAAADRALRAQRSLAAATQHLIVGQADDLEFERRLDVGLDECLEMAGGKTAALMACSASIGAHLAAAAEHDVLALEVFGYQLGLAFQLVDDLLGIWGSSASTGKPVGADLRARKKSLPVVAAMASGTAAGDELRRIYAAGDLRPDSADATIARAAALVDDAGGRSWAADEAARRLANASAALAAADLEPAAVEALIGIANYVTARDH